MQLTRSAVHPLQFGRRLKASPVDLPRMQEQPGWAADLRLFATTFAAGFLFVAVLIG